MKTTTKVIFGVVVIAALIAMFFVGRWLKEPVVVHQQREIDSLRNVHRQDSLKYAWELSGYDSTYHRLNTVIIGKNRQIVTLRKSLDKERKRLKSLPAIETVEQFSCNTGDSSWVAVRECDTVAISPLPAIRTANILIAERNVYRREISYQTAKTEAYKETIDTKTQELVLVRNRVIKLTDEYYKAQGIIDRQGKYLDKYAKKVRRRNIAIGVMGGISLGLAIAVVATAL